MNYLVRITISVLVAAMVFASGYVIGRQSMTQSESIQSALKEQMIRYHWDGLSSNDVQQMTFPKGTITASNGGSFVLGEFPTSNHPNNDRYLLAYGWLDKGVWDFAVLGWVGSGQGGGGGESITLDGRQVPLFVSWQWAPNNKAIEAVGMVKFTGLGKSSPYPMQRVGNLPLWVHKFDTKMFIAVPYKGFDANGNVVWDLWDQKGNAS